MFEGRNATPVSRWHLLPVCVALILSVQAFSQGLPPAFPSQDGSKNYAITADVNLVVLPVTVKDRSGHFVSGLEAANFRIYENGKPQKIALFRNDDVPVAVGLVVDHSASMAARQAEVITGARAFVQESNPQDREFVVNFSDTVLFGLPAGMEFTSKTEDLEAALSAATGGRTALYDAVAAALEHLQKDPLNKKVLLLISDGGDNASHQNFANVLRRAQATNAIIYAIGLFDEHSADQNPNVLKKLAAATGGQAYFPQSAADLAGICRHIAAEIRHQYTLGYSPENAGGAGYRKVRVVATGTDGKKLLVRTRSGFYFTPSDSRSQTGLSECCRNADDRYSLRFR